MCKLDVRSFLIEMNLRLKHCLSMAQDHQHAQEWTVTKAQRLNQFLRESLSLGTARIKGIVLDGKVSVNGTLVQQPGYFLKPGQRVNFNPNRQKKTWASGVKKLYLDREVVVIEKPAGLLSAPLPDGDEMSALTAARRFCRAGGQGRRVVHRLDKSTSGILVFGRGQTNTRFLSEQFQHRTLSRTYLAVVSSPLPKREGWIVSHLGRKTPKHPRASMPGSLKLFPHDSYPQPTEGRGRWAATRFRVLWSRGKQQGVLLNLLSGRTHQIRIHLSELGAPICGETVYAKTEVKSRLALHASKIKFLHPRRREEMTFVSPWPADLNSLFPFEIATVSLLGE